MPEPPAGGAAVRSARRRAGVTLRRLARDIGVSVGTMSAIENDKVRLTVERLQQIARCLDVPVNRLLEPPVVAEDGATRPLAAHPGEWRIFDELDLDPVLSSAIEVFSETGYHGATMRVIATGADISVPGLYHHYPSKQHLLVALLEIALHDLEWRVVAAGKDVDDPVDHFVLTVEALALYHAERAELASLALTEIRSVEEPNRERLTAVQRRVREALEEAATTAVRLGRFTAPDVRTTTRAISTMCLTLPYWFPESREAAELGPARLARHYAGLALAMMRPVAAAQPAPPVQENRTH
ncbi:TetR family transcriptional regulator [Pseudonocardia sp. NPDC049635]|uniref:TetR family transcriptional regulator n=1 Tax=Pseudonocardia sp. NPDC049635 TaxID=3155506 RepID=UPI0033FDACDA